jgi:hypothetical protein
VKQNSTAHLALLAALVLLIRLPFLNQAVGGDDVYYLAAAYHGLIDPLHPNHTWYVFEGRDVTFQGYPHPPGNAWVLCGLLTVFGDVREIPFHAAYLAFSMLAVFAMYALARRFSCRPFWAAALFAVIPAFLVNGNSFESDVPFGAFWMAGAAAFIYGVDRPSRRLMIFAAIFLACSAMIAMQAVLFTPILLAYLFVRSERRTWGRVLTAFTPVLALAAWQLFERVTSGQFPAAVTAGYLSSYGYTRVVMKLRNAVGLFIHLAFLVFPILLPFAVREAWQRRKDADTRFLLLWIAVFLAGACMLFYDGSARYLLPLAAPVVLLASRAPMRWVRAAFALQLVVSSGLAAVNYRHWNAYRKFAATMRAETQQKRVWVDAEWGLRHYLEADGALPLHRDQWIPTGDIVVQSELAFPAPYYHGGRTLIPVAEMEIRPWLPLRLIGLESRSGYSTSQGYLPYDFRGGIIDRVHAYSLEAHEPALSLLPMGAPAADSQILEGIYSNEGAGWRWMSGEGAVLLKSPRTKATFEVKLYIADAAPARTVRISVLGGPEVARTFPGPGSYTMTVPVDATDLAAVTVTIRVDRTFVAPGDGRKLGIILNEVGFVP